MMLALKTKSVARVFSRELREAVQDASDTAAHKAAKEVAAAARESMKPAPNVRWRRFHIGRGKRKRTIRVRKGDGSEPGDPPFRQSGRLARSVRAQDTYAGPTREAPYGRWLEHGTRKMAARPYMAPALERMRPRIPRKWRNLALRKTPAARRIRAKKVR
jgi:HK97 gp10 family phage protein